MAWTQDRIDELKRLWLDGHSAAAVARQLGGVTRNAVVGKVHRLGLSGRAQPSTPTRQKGALAERPPRLHQSLNGGVAVSPKPVAPRVEGFEEVEPTVPRVPLLKLGPSDCRFGLGDPRSVTFGFCGAPQVRGRYCARHAEIVYQPPSPARAKADGRLLEDVCRAG